MGNSAASKNSLEEPEQVTDFPIDTPLHKIFDARFVQQYSVEVFSKPVHYADPQPENVGLLYSNDKESLNKTLSGLASEMSALLESKQSSKIHLSAQKKSHLLKSMYESFWRSMDRERMKKFQKREFSLNALKSTSRGTLDSASFDSVQASVELIDYLIEITKQDNEVPNEMLNLCKEFIEEYPPLSLFDPKEFTADIEISLRPMFEFISNLGENNSLLPSEVKSHAIKCWLGMGMARGSMSILMDVSRSLLLQEENHLEIVDLKEYTSFLMCYEKNLQENELQQNYSIPHHQSCMEVSQCILQTIGRISSKILEKKEKEIEFAFSHPFGLEATNRCFVSIDSLLEVCIESVESSHHESRSLLSSLLEDILVILNNSLQHLSTSHLSISELGFDHNVFARILSSIRKILKLTSSQNQNLHVVSDEVETLCFNILASGFSYFFVSSEDKLNFLLSCCKQLETYRQHEDSVQNLSAIFLKASQAGVLDEFFSDIQSTQTRKALVELFSFLLQLCRCRTQRELEKNIQKRDLPTFAPLDFLCLIQKQLSFLCFRELEKVNDAALYHAGPNINSINFELLSRFLSSLMKESSKLLDYISMSNFEANGQERFSRILRNSILLKLTGPLLIGLIDSVHLVQLAVLCKIMPDLFTLMQSWENLSCSEDFLNFCGLSINEHYLESFESQHPYASHSEVVENVYFPGGNQLKVEFDSRCIIKNASDYLEIVTYSKGSQLDCFKYSGGSDSSPWVPINSQADRIRLHFKCNSEEVDWGYKVDIIATANVRMNMWLGELKDLIDLLFGKVVVRFLNSHKPTIAEVTSLRSLQHVVLLGGLTTPTQFEALLRCAHVQSENIEPLSQVARAIFTSESFKDRFTFDYLELFCQILRLTGGDFVAFDAQKLIASTESDDYFSTQSLFGELFGMFLSLFPPQEDYSLIRSWILKLNPFCDWNNDRAAFRVNLQFLLRFFSHLKSLSPEQLDYLERAMLSQKIRLQFRHFAVHLLANYTNILRGSQGLSLVLSSVAFSLSSSLIEESDSYSLPTLEANVSKGGRYTYLQLESAFFDIIRTLVAIEDLDDLALLSLFQLVVMTPTEDILHKVVGSGIMTKVEALLRFWSSNRHILSHDSLVSMWRNYGKEPLKPWHLRYGAWCFFRYVSYAVCALNLSDLVAQILQIISANVDLLRVLLNNEIKESHNQSLCDEKEGVSEGRFRCCQKCTFINRANVRCCLVCDQLLEDDSRDAEVAKPIQDHEESKSLCFTYQSDFDTNGILYFLGTNGKRNEWTNPHSLGIVDIKYSSIQSNSDPIGGIVGRTATRCVSRPNPFQWFCIDFRQRKVFPTFYTIRHYSSYSVEALRNWKLEGSNDGENWECLREHINDTTVKEKGQAASWPVLNASGAYSMFRIFMTGKNSNNSWYLALSGFEIYGYLYSEDRMTDLIGPKMANLAKSEVRCFQSVYDFWDTRNSAEVEYGGHDTRRPLTVRNVSSSNSWQVVKSSYIYKSGIHRQQVKINTSGATTNTWKIVVGVVPTTFSVEGQMSKCVGGSQGGWGYVAATGNKYESSTIASYGEIFGSGDTIGLILDFNQGTIEFLKNGVSQGIAFRTLKGPVHLAVSFTAFDTSFSILPSEEEAEEQKEALPIPSSEWEKRLSTGSFQAASNVWYKYNRGDCGFNGKPFAVAGLASSAEINLYLAQFCWVLFRCHLFYEGFQNHDKSAVDWKEVIINVVPATNGIAQALLLKIYAIQNISTSTSSLDLQVFTQIFQHMKNMFNCDDLDFLPEQRSPILNDFLAVSRKCLEQESIRLYFESQICSLLTSLNGENNILSLFSGNSSSHELLKELMCVWTLLSSSEASLSIGQVVFVRHDGFDQECVVTDFDSCKSTVSAVLPSSDIIQVPVVDVLVKNTSREFPFSFSEYTLSEILKFSSRMINYPEKGFLNEAKVMLLCLKHNCLKVLYNLTTLFSRTHQEVYQKLFTVLRESDSKKICTLTQNSSQVALCQIRQSDSLPFSFSTKNIPKLISFPQGILSEVSQDVEPNSVIKLSSSLVGFEDSLISLQKSYPILQDAEHQIVFEFKRHSMWLRAVYLDLIFHDCNVVIDIQVSTSGACWQTLRQNISIEEKNHIVECDSQKYWSHFRLLFKLTLINSRGNLKLNKIDFAGLYANEESSLSQSIHVEEFMYKESKRFNLSSDPGILFSFGKGDSGRLGHNSTVPVPTPSILQSIQSVKVAQVSSFGSHVIVLSTEGRVYTFGNGDHGRLGHGTRSQQRYPKQVDALKERRIVQAVAGNAFSLALDSEGKVWAWGQGSNGQMGDGKALDRLLPVIVRGLLENLHIVTIGAGGYHAFAVASSGDLFSWGKNQYGQLGINSTTLQKSPKKVTLPHGVSRFVQLVGGWDHSMALTPEGQLYSWGGGYELRRPVCGHGNNDKVLKPKLVEALVNEVVVQIAAGWDHSMALTNQGHVYCWGGNNGGSLGNEQASIHEFVPKRVKRGLENEKVVWIDGGQDHTTCVTEKGHIWTWGSGGAHLGHNDSTPLTSPRRVESVADKYMFQMVTCGQKSNFLLSCFKPPRVPPSPYMIGLQSSMSMSLPPYPRSVYILSKSSLENETKLNIDVVSNIDSTISGSYLLNEETEFLLVESDFRLEAPLFSNSEFSDFTVSMNMKSQGTEVFIYLKLLHVFSGKNSAHFEVSPDGEGHFSVVAGPSVISLTVPSFKTLWDECWHCVTLEHKQGQISLFLDSDLHFQTCLSEDVMSLLFTNDSRISFIEHYSGMLKSVAIFEIPIGSKNISRLVQSGLSFIEADLLDDEKHSREILLFEFDDLDTANCQDFQLSVPGKIQNYLERVVDPSTTTGFQVQERKFLEMQPGNWMTFHRKLGGENLVTGLKDYSIILDILLLQLPSSPICLFCNGSFLPLQVLISEEGKLGFGTGKYGSKRLIKPMKGSRVAITVSHSDRAVVSVYLDGNLATKQESSADQCFFLLEELFFLFGTIACPLSSALSVAAIQMRDSCLSAKDIRALGSYGEVKLDSGRSLKSLCSSLIQMGYPQSWCEKALRHCKFSRNLASDWIFNNYELLLQEEKAEKSRNLALNLSSLGYSYSKTLECLKSGDGEPDVPEAISSLLKSDGFDETHLTNLAHVTLPSSVSDMDDTQICLDVSVAQEHILSSLDSFDDVNVSPSAVSDLVDGSSLFPAPNSILESSTHGNSVQGEPKGWTAEILKLHESLYQGSIEVFARDLLIRMMDVTPSQFLVSSSSQLLLIFSCSPLSPQNEIIFREFFSRKLLEESLQTFQVSNLLDLVRSSLHAGVLYETLIIILFCLSHKYLLMDVPKAVKCVSLLLDVFSGFVERLESRHSSFASVIFNPQLLALLLISSVKTSVKASAVLFLSLSKVLKYVPLCRTSVFVGRKLREFLDIMKRFGSAENANPNSSHKRLLLHAIIEANIVIKKRGLLLDTSDEKPLIFEEKSPSYPTPSSEIFVYDCAVAGEPVEQEQIYWDAEDAVDIEVFGDDPLQPTSVRKVGGSNNWRAVKTSQSFDSGRHNFEVCIVADPPSSNAWGTVIGVVPSSFKVNHNGSRCVGGTRGGWGLICGTGLKYHKGSSLPYSPKIEVGDTITVVLDLDVGTIEYLRNGTSLGVAFKNVTGPVQLAVSMTSIGAQVTLVNSST